MRIVLASASPRRKELLEKAGIDFIVDASSIDETLDETLALEERLRQLAIDKTMPIHHKYPHDVVLGADTTVYFDSQIIGKAKDKDDARHILKMLSNQKHSVYTAVAIYIKNELYTFVERTDVYFKDITDMIEPYITSGEWQGKAGAYGIQGYADCFVERVEGDIDNVIGLPLQKVMEFFNEKQIMM